MRDRREDVAVVREIPRRAAPIELTSRIFRALASPAYRLVFFGFLLSNTGTWLQKTAQSWLVLTLSDSAFYLGLDAFASDVPLMLFALLGGVAADRFDRRKLLIAAQLTRLVLAGSLAALAYTDTIQVWHIIGLSFLAGCVDAVSVPAFLSYLPTLVSRHDLPSALALNSTQFNVSRIIGPAVAGFILLSSGPALCFLLNAFSFLAVVFSLLLIRSADQRPSKVVPVWQSLRQGAEYLRRNQILSSYLLAVFCFSFTASPLLTLLPLFARDVLQVGVAGFSQLLSLFGLGAVTGALGVAGALNLRRKIDRVLLSMLVFALCLLTFALSQSWALTAAAAVMAGASMISSTVMLNTMVQNEAPRVLRGRIMSMYGLALRGGIPLGSLAGGAVAASWSGPAAATLLALILLAFLAVFWIGFRPRFQALNR